MKTNSTLFIISRSAPLRMINISDKVYAEYKKKMYFQKNFLKIVPFMR